jgi:hypothetical protein
MSQLWNRVYRLSVIEQKVTIVNNSPPPKITQDFYSAWRTPPIDGSLAGDPNPLPIPQSSPTAVSGDSTAPNQTKTLSGGDSVLIKDLHITADIDSATKEGDVAKATIRIYNASKDTRVKLERKNAYVILEAGYGNDYGIVFTGTVLRASSRKEGTEMVTELLCSDSNIQLKTGRVSYAWPAGTTYATIIDDVAKAFQSQGIARGFVETKAKNLPTLQSPAETTATGGYSFQGLSSQLLDKLCEQFQYVWYITLNELYIHPRTFNSFTVQYDVSAQIIKSLEPTQESTDEVPSVETKSRYQLITFLDHRIKTGQRIRLIEGRYKGTYKVISVSTSLSYFDGDWDSNIIIEEV